MTVKNHGGIAYTLLIENFTDILTIALQAAG